MARLLVVEDDPDVLDLISMRLVMVGHRVIAMPDADLALVSAIPDLEKIPVGDRLNPDKLAADIATRGGNARYVNTVDDIVSIVRAEAKAGDVVAVLSNGGFGGIHGKLIERLKSRK